MDKNGRISRLLSRFAGTLILAVLFLCIGCPNKITVKPETFAVTFSAGEHGTVGATVDSKPISSGNVVQKDKTVVFTAVPEKGYEVEKWTVNGTVITNTATTYSHKVTAKTDVKVLFKASAVAVIDVMLNKSELTLEEGKSEQLTATVAPTNATNKKVTWGSDKPAIASVDATGKVTAKAEGTAKITVTTEDGSKTAECKVTVTAKALPPVPKPKHTVTFSVEGGNGTLKAMVDGIEINSGDKVEKDKTVTFTATANTGYEVDKWTISGSSFESGSGADGSTTAKVKVTANTTVNVTFKLVGGTPPTPPASADKTYTVEGIGFTMKGIAAVTNGSVGDNSQGDNKHHTVSLTAYRIGETEVTQELWQAVMGKNPSWFKGTGNPPDGSEVQGKRPVESVDWYECIAFCNELTKKVAELGESQCVYTVDGHTYGTADATAKKEPTMDMSKKGFRLPTEAEWEWAAKGGTEYKWAGANEKNKLGEYAWYSANSGGKTHEVKQKQANGYGLYDMSGNVWEWCWDWYDTLPNPLPADYPGAASGERRVERGGSWQDGAYLAARACRVRSYPFNRYYLGLRLALRP